MRELFDHRPTYGNISNQIRGISFCRVTVMQIYHLLFLTFCACHCFCPWLAAQDAPAAIVAVTAAEGRSASWMNGTESIRKHLSELDCADARVRRYLPAIERRCTTLMRLGNMGSYEWDIFGRFFDAMLEDLVRGEKVLARFSGQTVNYGYWSKHINKLTGTKVQIPPDYNDEREYQFFMYYKMGGGMYWRSPTKKWAGPGDEGAVVSPPHRPTAAMCQNTPETFHAWSALYYGVKGRMGLVEELKELTHAMCQDFSMSPDRVFLSGYSDGGFSAMWLASRYPHLVAGIAPGVANWQYGNMGYYTFFNFATLVVDGWGDGGYIQENLDRFTALNNMGYDISALVSHHGHETKWLEEESTVRKIMDWARTKRRDLNRKHIKYATWNLFWNRAFSFTIERMETPLLAALVDAQIEGNTIQVKAKNIAAYRIALNDKLLDMDKNVKIYTNGMLSYDGPCTDEVFIELIKHGDSKFVKTDAMHGGMAAHAFRLTYFNKKSNHKKFRLPSHPWTWVHFTGGENAEAELAVLKPANWVRPDEKVDQELMDNNNLFIMGGPLRNKLVAQFADDLPVKFEKGKFTIGSRVYDEPQHCVKFIMPNPLSPERFCVIVAYNDPIAAAEALKPPGLDISPWGFRSGDCIVYGIKKSDAEFNAMPDKQKKKKGSRYKTEHFIFDTDWKPFDDPAVGTTEQDFGWDDILQLKAAAIKEAMHADVGLYRSQPGFLQWKTSFEKGPITMHDVAVTNQVPEFIMTCELTGAQLKGFVGPDSKGTTHTVFTDTDEPGYDAKTSLLFSDIQDDKVYKVAAGYTLCDNGSLGLSWMRDKMPSPFAYFETVAEYTALEGGGVRSQNLMQSEVEVTEAVVNYIKKRDKIVPGMK